jgi:predicted Fe-Mo cluster-binding NifX family protein
MKIAVTSSGTTLDDVVAVGFGRCPYFLIVDPDTMEFDAYPNPNINQFGGAGVQSARFMADRDVSVVLTGRCGPNAIQTFGAAGIKVVTGVSGTVNQVVQQYNAGKLVATSLPELIGNYGTGRMDGGRGISGIKV